VAYAARGKRKCFRICTPLVLARACLPYGWLWWLGFRPKRPMATVPERQHVPTGEVHDDSRVRWHALDQWGPRTAL
jgi:hypothetical protein